MYRVCQHGLARTLLYLGDIKPGIELALQLEDDEKHDASRHGDGDGPVHSHGHGLVRECAAILERMKQYNEAANPAGPHPTINTSKTPAVL